MKALETGATLGMGFATAIVLFLLVALFADGVAGTGFGFGCW